MGSLTFFDSIDHEILLRILRQYISDDRILRLLERIIRSFSTEPGKGLPLGNLTSQLFANIYLNELDQFMKHTLKARRYVRYADDFVILSESRERLEDLIPEIRGFLRERLVLELHPDKVFIKTFASGIDFLGWVHFLDHRVLRTTTKRRMLRRLRETHSEATISSYRGLLQHGNAYGLTRLLESFV